MEDNIGLHEGRQSPNSFLATHGPGRDADVQPALSRPLHTSAPSSGSITPCSYVTPIDVTFPHYISSTGVSNNPTTPCTLPFLVTDMNITLCQPLSILNDGRDMNLLQIGGNAQECLTRSESGTDGCRYQVGTASVLIISVSSSLHNVAILRRP